MKQKAARLPILLASAVPYGFLAMGGDFALRILWPYLLWIACLVLLCLPAVRTRNVPALLLGGGCGGLLSWVLLFFLGTEEWVWYFKPFSPAGRLIFLSVLALLGQGLLCLLLSRGGRRKSEG